MCIRDRVHDAAGESAHGKQGEEPDDQSVQALGAGKHLEDQALGEMLRVLTQDAGSGLAHHAGAFRGADAAQAHRQRGAQERQTNTAKLSNEFSHVNFPP